MVNDAVKLWFDIQNGDVFENARNSFFHYLSKHFLNCDYSNLSKRSIDGLRKIERGVAYTFAIPKRFFFDCFDKFCILPEMIVQFRYVGIINILVLLIFEFSPGLLYI